MKKISLKTQVMIGCVLFTILLTAAIGISGFLQYKRNITQKYYDYARTIVDLGIVEFEKNQMVELVKARSMGDDYEETRKALNAIKENSDIAYIFGIFFEDTTDPDSLCFAINGATAEDLERRDEKDVYSFMGEPASEGDFDEAMRKAYLDSYLSGSEDVHFYDNITEEYGHMLTCYRVMHDESGEPVCILSVDVDVNDIRSNLNYYITRMLIIACILMILLLITFVGAVDRFVTDPVTRIAKSADHFVGLLKREAKPEELIFEAIRIRSENDIRKLSDNVGEMASSIRDYMINLEAVTAERERIGAELALATQIQEDLLPRLFPAFPERKELEIYGTMKPAKEVGGDFYDFFFIDHDHLAMVIADVSGKGVPAALFMVIAKTLIKNQAQTSGHYSPAKVLNVVNNQLCEANDADLFVTVWLAIIDLRTGEGISANAGHEHPAVRVAGGEYELVKYRHSPAIAALEGLRFKDREFRLNPGDSLFVYTDGVTEATSADQELYGEKRLLAALNKEPEAPLEKLLGNVKEDIRIFTGTAPQFDDITMLGFLYKGPETDEKE